MSADSEPAPAIPQHPKRSWARSIPHFLVVFLVAYLILAYVVIPGLWKRYEHRHPALDSTPTVTRTGDDHPGDPINVALIGTEENITKIMAVAAWIAADPLGLKSDLKIAADTIAERPYDKAPVSNLYLFGRKEDLAFEQPVGNDPRQRHHVRFWKSDKTDDQGRPLWAGAVTFDRKVGLSHTTGQITHHIDGNIDAERDRLFDQLKATHALSEVQVEENFQPLRTGTNGGGDPWNTDGSLFVGTVVFPVDPVEIAPRKE